MATSFPGMVVRAAFFSAALDTPPIAVYAASMTRLLRFAPLFALVSGCLTVNPAYDGATSGEGEASTAGRAGESDGTDASVGGSATADSASAGGTSSGSTGPLDSTSTTSSGPTILSSSSSGSASSSSSTGAGPDPLEPGDLGQGCRSDDECDELLPGALCCDEEECEDTCMVPCFNANECPFVGMGCHHGHCLFPCDDSNADCAGWPGYSCQHGGNFCESD